MSGRHLLTARQEAFCQAYMAHGGNAAAAYRMSYDTGRMARKTIWEKASRLSADGKVQARVAELRDAAARRAVVEESRVLEELTRIAFSDIGELFDESGTPQALNALPPDVRAAIAVYEKRDANDGDGNVSVTSIRIKLWDKIAALHMLMKHLGMFDRQNRQRPGLFDKLPIADVARIKNHIDELLASQSSRGEPPERS